MQQFSLSVQPRLLRYGILGGRITLKRHPLISKAIPTAVGFAFGDCLTQVSWSARCLVFARLPGALSVRGKGLAL
eukprot:scaffold16824_cov17-Tisochrysis_lutea.AAC.1